MPAGLTMTRLRLLAGMLLVGLLLGGCGSRNLIEQPAPVPEIDAEVAMKTVWRMSVGKGHQGQFLYLEPVILDDILYVASANGVVVAAAMESGDVQWRRNLRTGVMSGVGGDDQQVYVTTRNAELVALSRETGEERWRASLPNESMAAPGSNGSVVVAQTIDGKVLAFDTRTGNRRWQYDGVVPVLSFRGTATPVVGNDLTLLAFASGQLFAVSSDTGQPAWQYAVGEPRGRTELERLVDVDGTPLVRGNVVYVTGYQGRLAALDRRTGREFWSRNVSSLQPPVQVADTLFVASANGDIVAYDEATRRELWRQDQLAWRQPTAMVEIDDYLLVGDFEGFVHVMSKSSGRLVGQRQFDARGVRASLMRWNDYIVVYGNSGVLRVVRLGKPSLFDFFRESLVD
ncbi:MAG: outer membrane protein assembly factor BamB [Marinobacter sp.]|nr:outer membrane protein assembly factor BamB [Marinobacter sp.]